MMTMAIMLKPNLRILAITLCRHLSSSPFPPFPNENPFSDIKKNLKPSQPPSHVITDPPPSPPSSDNAGKNPNISEIQMHLSQFRQQNPFRNADPNLGSISIQDIMNRRANKQNNQNSNTRMNFDAISESLKNFRPNPQSSMRGFNLFPNRRNPEAPTVGNLEKSKLPESVFGKELREKFGGVEEEAGKLESTEFLKIYTHEELGQKLKSLRPEDSQEGKNDWFSLEELNVRLSKLRELEQKETDPKVHGLSLADLTDSLKHIAQKDKLTAQSMSMFATFNSLTTPNYTPKPPPEQLLDNYFHPDHMSPAEKMKLDLKKVRDDYKMPESDCGSTRVQIRAPKQPKGKSKMPKVRARGPDDKVVITLNEDGQPVSDNIFMELSNFLGTLAKDNVSLTYINWHVVPDQLKRQMLEYTLDRYVIPDEGHNWVLNTLNDSWRRYKYRMKARYYKKYPTDEQRLANRPNTIPLEDFRMLLKYWGDESVQALAATNSAHHNSLSETHTRKKVHGLSLADLRDSLKRITQKETMNRNKLTAAQVLLAANYTLKPPQEQLLDNAEKMKLDLQKVRDDYGMWIYPCSKLGSRHR